MKKATYFKANEDQLKKYPSSFVDNEGYFVYPINFILTVYDDYIRYGDHADKLIDIIYECYYWRSHVDELEESLYKRLKDKDKLFFECRYKKYMTFKDASKAIGLSSNGSNDNNRIIHEFKIILNLKKIRKRRQNEYPENYVNRIFKDWENDQATKNSLLEDIKKYTELKGNLEEDIKELTDEKDNLKSDVVKLNNKLLSLQNAITNISNNIKFIVEETIIDYQNQYYV